MNREQRRKEQKSQKKIKRYPHSYDNLSLEERKEQLFKNGITIKDLEDAHKQGFDQGFQDKALNILSAVYAASLLMLKDLYGVDNKQALEALKVLDHKFSMALCTSELVDEVFEEFGIMIDFADPIDRIQEA